MIGCLTETTTYVVAKPLVGIIGEQGKKVLESSKYTKLAIILIHTNISLSQNKTSHIKLKYR